MTLSDRIAAFSKLGTFLHQCTESRYSHSKSEGVFEAPEHYEELTRIIESAVHYNGWFTKENVHFSLAQWSAALTSENLNHWVAPYTIAESSDLTIAIILAGNIPLVGFHDVLSVLISGHHVIIKPSSNDDKLVPYLISCLIAIQPAFKDRIAITEGKLSGFDAMIATGSNNTARYFEHYFSHVPHIIRKNRNSVAVLTGTETPEELHALGNDIFQYYGLGCRSVSKLYVPKGYDFDLFFKGIYNHNTIINGAKYANNYDYNKAVYLMSNFKLLDNGFVLLKEDTQYSSPIASLFYETYDTITQLQDQLNADTEKIQCIVSTGFSKTSINFGDTQCPKLWDYADGVDTLSFLTQLIE